MQTQLLLEHCKKIGIICFMFALLVILVTFSDRNYTAAPAVFTANGEETLRPSPNIFRKDGCMGITKKRFPTAIIAGVTKGGTTALTKFLNAHPRIAARYAREEAAMHTAFFCYNDGYINYHIYEYRDMMPCSYSDQITIERSPAYFNTKDTPGRIRKFNPNMKIIVIVKDPIIRAHSHYLMWKATKKTQNNTFEQSVMKDRLTKVDEDSHLIFVSRYSQHVKPWLENFKLDNILFLDSQNFVLDPVAELNKVEDFLGIERYFTNNMFAYSTERKMYCRLTEENNLDCMKKGKGRIHPPIHPDVKEKLQNYFRPLNDIFFQAIKRKFDWGY